MKKSVSMTSLTGFLFLVMILPSLASADVDKSAVMKKVSGLQMPFIENQGQVRDASVRFYANTFAGTVYVTDNGEIVYGLVKAEPAAKNTKDRDIKSALRSKDQISKAMVLRESLEGLKKKGSKGETATLHPVGINKSVTKVNYFSGKKENWRTGIPTWQEVSLGEVYQGIELKLRAYENNVEKLFTVRPGRSVEKIRLKIEGAKGLSVNKNGELEIDTALGTVEMTKPVAFQEIDGKRVEVAANYIVSDQSSGLTYGFQVGQYDNTKPLVIDPLLASTFLGGYSGQVESIAVNNSGDVYVAGEGFILMLDSELENLLAATFFDESIFVNVKALTIDSRGNLYATGWTTQGFPITPGAYDSIFGNQGSFITYEFDGFLLKLDRNLKNLLASTYIDGVASQEMMPTGFDVTTDYKDNVYVVGSGTMSDGSFYSSMVSKFDNNLENLLAYRRLGGSPYSGPSVTTDAIETADNGNVYIMGETGDAEYPTTPGAYDRVLSNRYEIFISKFDSNLETLLASTFLGGSSGWNKSLAVDSIGNVYVASFTSDAEYPTTPGAYDRILSGDTDAFISKFDSNLETLLASTFLGGSARESSKSITLDSSGNVYVSGWTGSEDFPTTPDAYDTTYNGECDAFVSKLDGKLENLYVSSFLGGDNDDWANSITIDDRGNVYVAGGTYSSDFPVTPDAYDTTYNGGSEAFVSKFFWEEESGSSQGKSCR